MGKKITGPLSLSLLPHHSSPPHTASVRIDDDGFPIFHFAHASAVIDDDGLSTEVLASSRRYILVNTLLFVLIVVDLLVACGAV